MSATAFPTSHPHPHRVTGVEFFRMGEAGVLDPDARIELIEGEMIDMPPIAPPHAGRTKRLNLLLIEAIGRRAIVSTQDPILLGHLRAPEPDLAVLKPRDDFYTSAHPRADAYQYSSARGGYSSPFRSGDVLLDGVRIYDRALSQDEIIVLSDIEQTTTSPLAATRLSYDDFKKDQPTCVITHGWQPSYDYEKKQNGDAFESPDHQRPSGQDAISLEIQKRLGNESLAANIVYLEWEGAYTGETGAPRARNNAGYAGYLLGHALSDAELFGDEYNGNVHLIGHSFGTIVNGVAANFLARWADMEENAKLQFTTLDAPTAVPSLIAPNFTENWFEFVLADEADFFDNYYSAAPFNPALIFGEGGYGESIKSADVNQIVGFCHGDVGSEFYPDFIENGDKAEFGRYWSIKQNPILPFGQGEPIEPESEIDD